MPFSVISETQRALLAALHIKGVRFVVVGGYAVRVHGPKRQVEDLDLLVDTTEENLSKLREALTAANAMNTEQIVAHMSKPEAKTKWLDVEFFSSMHPLQFDVVYKSASTVEVEGCGQLVMSKTDLIHSKRVALAASDRGCKSQQDREDLIALVPGF